MDLKEVTAGLPETRQIYLEDPYRRVNSCTILRAVKEGGKSYYVVIDGTIFHPKSGGQPSDVGWVKGDGFLLEVKKVFRVGVSIILWGRCEGVPAQVQVEERIDWDRRYLYMRRHAAAHLFDATLDYVTGTLCDPKDSWLGDNPYVGYRGFPPTDEQMSKVSELIRECIAKNYQVTSRIVSRNEIEESRSLWSSVIESLERVRLVQINGFRPIPCGGTHVHSLGEIKGVNLLGIEKVPEGFNVRFDVQKME
jgi:alanyl-tRNA synthetase